VTGVHPRLRSILVVDDDRPTRFVLERMLTSHGYDVTTAENGRVAMEALEARPYSLVLTDWSMPEMDGEALCRWIRGRGHEEYVYVIILTAASDREYLMAEVSLPFRVDAEAAVAEMEDSVFRITFPRLAENRLS